MPPKARPLASVVVASPSPVDPRLPPPGTVLRRRYKGRVLQVLVLADGFEFEGRRYPWLSAVAKAITGSHINGYRFFRLGAWGLGLEGKKHSHVENESGRSACGRTAHTGRSTSLPDLAAGTQDDGLE